MEILPSFSEEDFTPAAGKTKKNSGLVPCCTIIQLWSIRFTNKMVLACALDN
jgi:hypothetical protein